MDLLFLYLKDFKYIIGPDQILLLKPKNILIFDNYILKLTDFSFLTKIESRKEGEWGSPGYETPEFFEKKFNELLKNSIKNMRHYQKKSFVM